MTNSDTQSSNKGIQHYRRIAEDATPGKWELGECIDVGESYHDPKEDRHYSEIGPVVSCDGCGIAMKPDGDFISTFNPSTILKILNIIQLQDKALDELSKLTHVEYGDGSGPTVVPIRVRNVARTTRTKVKEMLDDRS